MSAEEKQRDIFAIVKAFRVLREKRRLAPSLTSKIFDYLDPLRVLLWLRFPFIRSCCTSIREVKSIKQLDFDRACVDAADKDLELFRWATSTQPLMAPEMAYYAGALYDEFPTGHAMFSSITPERRIRRPALEHRIQIIAAKNGSMTFLRKSIECSKVVAPPTLASLSPKVGFDALLEYACANINGESYEELFLEELGFSLRKMQDVRQVVKMIIDKTMSSRREGFSQGSEDEKAYIMNVLNGAMSAASLRRDAEIIGGLHLLASTFKLSLESDSSASPWLNSETAGSIVLSDFQSVLAESQTALDFVRRTKNETDYAGKPEDCFFYREDQALELLKIKMQIFVEVLKHKHRAAVERRKRELQSMLQEQQKTAPPPSTQLFGDFGGKAFDFKEWQLFGTPWRDAVDFKASDVPSAGDVSRVSTTGEVAAETKDTSVDNKDAPLENKDAPLRNVCEIKIDAATVATIDVSAAMTVQMQKIAKLAIRYNYFKVIQWLHGLRNADEESGLKTNVIPSSFTFNILSALLERPKNATALEILNKISPEEIPVRTLAKLWTLALSFGNTAALEALQKIDSKTTEIPFPVNTEPPSSLTQVQENYDYDGACEFLIGTGLIWRFSFDVGSLKEKWQKEDKSVWHRVLVKRLPPEQFAALLR